MCNWIKIPNAQREFFCLSWIKSKAGKGNTSLTCGAAHPDLYYSKALTYFPFKYLKLKLLGPKPIIEKCFRRKAQLFPTEFISLLPSPICSSNVMSFRSSLASFLYFLTGASLITSGNGLPLFFQLRSWCLRLSLTVKYVGIWKCCLGWRGTREPAVGQHGLCHRKGLLHSC